MATIEVLVAELKTLTPDELEDVARIVHDLSARRDHSVAGHAPFAIPDSVIAEGIRNGWPPELFTNAIGRIDEDFERPCQIPYEVRRDL